MSEPAKAPERRLIEWTGERCVPWVQDAAMLYQHFHRYLWVAELVGGRRVLDLGSGEGFGAAILAVSAASVVGVDIDARTVEHATLRYAAETLAFEQSSALDLSRFPDAGFGAVIVFEMIEHVEDHERLLSEVTRVLAPDGIFAVSTPDKDLYSAASGQDNPFHEHELSRGELTDLLARSFEHVAIWGQRTITGSYLSAVGRPARDRRAPRADFFVEHTDRGLERVEQGEPLFYVALASRVPLPEVDGSSTLADFGLELLHETARAHAVAVAERDRLLSEVNADAKRRLDEKYEELVTLDAELARVRDELHEARRFVSRLEQSVSWQTFQRARALLYGTIGENSRLARGLSSALRLLGRITLRRRD